MDHVKKLIIIFTWHLHPRLYMVSLYLFLYNRVVEVHWSSALTMKAAVVLQL